MSQSKMDHSTASPQEALQRLRQAIAEAESQLGVKVSELPELTEEDHDRLAYERRNHFRTMPSKR